MKNRISSYAERAALLDFLIERKRKINRGIAIGAMVYYIFFLWIMIGAIYYNYIVGMKRVAIIVICIAFFLFILLYIVKPELVTRKKERKARAELQQFSKEEYHDILFTDHEIQVLRSDRTNIHPYNQIRKIKESSQYAIIYVTNKLAVVVDKGAFYDGTWEECRQLLKENGVK